MKRRSRNGCLDCKRAKVKCDEVWPACGTCHRRGYVCQGYGPTGEIGQSPPKVESRGALSKHRPGRSVKKATWESYRRASLDSHATSGAEPEQATSSPSASLVDDGDAASAQSNEESGPISRRTSLDPAGQSSHLPPGLSLLPPGTIPIADEPVLELYFRNHPPTQALGPEYVHEMNSSVIQVFHVNPGAVLESLSAIGHIYMRDDKSIVSILDRRARILSKLRSNRDIESTLCMLLSLCALEMIDDISKPLDTSLPTLIVNAAMIMKHYHSTGQKLSPIAKYFIRALARQDMMVSLTYLRPPVIPYDIWLDHDCKNQADRFMGYTMTLMPILTELCHLAESARQRAVPPAQDLPRTSQKIEINDAKSRDSEKSANVLQRAIDLHTALTEWRPPTIPETSQSSSENMLLHALAYKAAALLYLHRLMNPHGLSEESDRIALGIAHEILMRLSNVSDQLKTALWPLFLTASELKDESDRKTALRLFDKLFSLRKTVTTRRTKDFIVNRVWKARAEGIPWNWMELVYKHPGECLPI